jgi:hypothetical protein
MRYRLFLVFALLVLGGASLRAQTLAFAPNGTGIRQDYRYSLGLFFDLTAPLTIASVGYWDDNLDGVDAALSVVIFDRSGTPAIVSGTQADFSGTLGTLFGPIVANQNELVGSSGRPGQFRMLNLPAPVTLPIGQYALVAWGFSFSNEILNGTNTGPTVDVNTFGGILNFVEARYADFAGVLPSSLDQSFAQYASATFSTGTISAVPEPANVAFALGTGGLLLGFIARRRKRELS